MPHRPDATLGRSHGQNATKRMHACRNERFRNPNTKGSNADVQIPEPTISEFKAGLRGELIRPGEAGYDLARKILTR